MYLFEAAFLGFFFMQILQNEARLVCKHNSLSLSRGVFFPMLWNDQSISCNSKLWGRIQLTLNLTYSNTNKVSLVLKAKG